MQYEEKQYGRILVLVNSLFVLLVALSSIFSDTIQNIDTRLLISYFILMTFITALFYKLQITVTSSCIQLRFGVGLIQKKIELDAVASVIEVKNKWWHGWGIRRLPNTWMWNIDGLTAVEISYKDSPNKFRIGCVDSLRLKQEIVKRLQ